MESARPVAWVFFRFRLARRRSDLTTTGKGSFRFVFPSLPGPACYGLLVMQNDASKPSVRLFPAHAIKPGDRFRLPGETCDFRLAIDGPRQGFDALVIPFENGAGLHGFPVRSLETTVEVLEG